MTRSNLFYFGTTTEVKLGDRVKLKRLLRGALGVSEPIFKVIIRFRVDDTNRNRITPGMGAHISVREDEA